MGQGTKGKGYAVTPEEDERAAMTVLKNYWNPQATEGFLDLLEETLHQVSVWALTATEGKREIQSLLAAGRLKLMAEKPSELALDRAMSWATSVNGRVIKDMSMEECIYRAIYDAS